MYGQNKRAVASGVRQAKFFAVPAAVIGGWLLLFGGFVSSVSQPTSLQAAINKVLSTPKPTEPAGTLVADRSTTVKRTAAP